MGLKIRLDRSEEEFESFIKGMKRLSTFLQSQKPDYIFAPVVGAVPLIDVLCILDKHLPLEIVEYPPNSSRIKNREELMQRWYKNFLERNYTKEPMKICTIEEIISGASAL
ncbi:MAG: hypothetical protein N3G19_03785, partial [Candidatus Pacearchaeota archaeon]|nr:hypothetical protein [Candidatus Pacearchaeota archaeon]